MLIYNSRTDWDVAVKLAQTLRFVACLFAMIGSATDAGENKDVTVGLFADVQKLKQECDSQIGSLNKKFQKDSAVTKSLAELNRLKKNLQVESDIVVNAAANKVFVLVQPHVAEDAAIEPLAWIATQASASDLGQTVAGLLIEHHLTDKKTLELAFALRRSGLTWVERMLRAQLAAVDLPEDQRPRQLLALAQTLYAAVERRQVGYRELEVEAVQLFDELRNRFADKEYRGGVSFGDLAASSLFEIKNLSIGKVVPEIIGEDLDGKTFKLSDYRGKVVVISFWATWCGPCMAELPHERELVTRFEGRPFVIVGVNADSLFS